MANRGCGFKNSTGRETFPKNHLSDMIVVDALLNRDTGESLKGIPCEKDWLLFTIRQRSENIQPLRFRTAQR